MSNKRPDVAYAAGGEGERDTWRTAALQPVAVREASGLASCILSDIYECCCGPLLKVLL